MLKVGDRVEYFKGYYSYSPSYLGKHGTIIRILTKEDLLVKWDDIEEIKEHYAANLRLIICVEERE
jgi:hypothetical protein